MKRKFVNYLRSDEEAGANISWGSIFAGVVTFMAVFITLSFISSALGFGILEPTSNDPLDGVGTGVLVWTVISLIISFLCAGFISGVAAQRVGMLHGIVTWAASILIAFILISYTAVSAISGVGKLVGNVGSAVASGTANVAESAGNAASAGVDKITSNLNVDTEELDANVKEILKDTDVEELQPAYLQGQLDQAGEEIKEAAKQIAVNPDQSDQIIKDTTESLKARAENIANAADRDAIKNAVEKNTDLTPEETDKAVDNIYNGLQEASSEAEQKLNQASDEITKLQIQAEETVEDVREGAEEASNKTALASGLTFLGLALGLILSASAGVYGSRLGKDEEVKVEL